VPSPARTTRHTVPRRGGSLGDLADLAESLSLDALTVSRLVPPPEMEAMRAAHEIRLRARSMPTATFLAPPRAAPPRSSDPAVLRATWATDAGAVRTWVRAHGYAVGDRGRMPAEIIAVFLPGRPSTPKSSDSDPQTDALAADVS